jgi:hypothetical protein
METWKTVPGWAGWYEVSDAGHVRSLPRQSKANGAPAVYSGRVLKACTLKNGYLQVSLSRPGERRYAYVHRLVLEAFAGTAPAGMEVCHADGSRNNNSLSNLRYGTRSENARDRIAHGRGPDGVKVRGEKNGLTHLTETDVRCIRGMPGTLKEIASHFGVHFGTIHNIKTGKTWGHVD